MCMVVTVALALFLYINIWFVVACIKKRNDVADIAWGLGFVLMSWLALLFSEHSMRSLLVNTLVTIWGLRLTWHIARRNSGKPEDKRYAEWRAQWKYFYCRSYVQIFLLQGLILFLVMLPILHIHGSASVDLGLVDAIGVLMWIVGFVFELVGDHQLKMFLLNPMNRGKIMDSGLWAYSRHPNYFGEVTQWWSIFLLAVSLPFGFLTVVSPLLITLLIVFVSGVPMLEKKYAGRPDFETYKKRTSMLFPLPNRKVQ